jgi:hypothetical protein
MLESQVDRLIRQVNLDLRVGTRMMGCIAVIGVTFRFRWRKLSMRRARCCFRVEGIEERLQMLRDLLQLRGGRFSMG